MVATVHITGVGETLAAFRELPRRVRFKHLRIALNAGGGVIRDRAAQLARRQTGLLSKSIGVKVSIPDASYNTAHHGKPAYAVIGPKRFAGRMMRLNKQNRLKGFGKAQSALTAERKRLNKEGKLSPLRRETAAVKAVLSKHADAVYRNPARYAHLVEKGHAKGKGRSAARPYPFLEPAVRQTKSIALQRISDKLKTGLDNEARALAGAGG